MVFYRTSRAELVPVPVQSSMGVDAVTTSICLKGEEDEMRYVCGYVYMLDHRTEPSLKRDQLFS